MLTLPLVVQRCYYATRSGRSYGSGGAKRIPLFTGQYTGCDLRTAIEDAFKPGVP